VTVQILVEVNKNKQQKQQDHCKVRQCWKGRRKRAVVASSI